MDSGLNTTVTNSSSIFPFLDLPPELRNMIYTLVHVDIGFNLTLPQAALPNGYKTGMKEYMSCLPLTCKQIYAEAFQDAYSSAAIYWPNSPEGGPLYFRSDEPYCLNCDWSPRWAEIEQMGQALCRYGDNLKHVKHLNVWGEMAEAFVWEIENASENDIIPCYTCRSWCEDLSNVAGKLTARLGRVETVTVFVDDRIATVFRKDAAGTFQGFLEMFPKLKFLPMGTAKGVEVIAEKEFVVATLRQ